MYIYIYVYIYVHVLDIHGPLRNGIQVVTKVRMRARLIFPIHSSD